MWWRPLVPDPAITWKHDDSKSVALIPEIRLCMRGGVHMISTIGIECRACAGVHLSITRAPASTTSSPSRGGSYRFAATSKPRLAGSRPTRTLAFGTTHAHNIFNPPKPHRRHEEGRACKGNVYTHKGLIQISEQKIIRAP